MLRRVAIAVDIACSYIIRKADGKDARHASWMEVFPYFRTVLVSCRRMPQDDARGFCDVLYALVVMQAFFMQLSVPFLLLTPELCHALFAVNEELQPCRIMEGALGALRLYFQAVHGAVYGRQTFAFVEVWQVLPWFGITSALTGVEQLPWPEAQFFSDVIMNIEKEQLCTNAETLAGWQRPGPPYVDHFDVVLPFLTKYASPPLVVPPLSVFGAQRRVSLQKRGSARLNQELKCVVLQAVVEHDASVLTHLRKIQTPEAWICSLSRFDALKRYRLLGGFGKRMLGLDQVLHWELRQSLEAHLGFLLLVALHGNLPSQSEMFTIRDLLICAGIAVSDPVSPEEYQALRFAEHTGHHQSQHQKLGLALNRLCITDRWGKYREFDAGGNVLIARACHRNKDKGCPDAFAFSRCGCACPCMHARHWQLGNWMVSKCRNDAEGQATAPLTGWPLDVAERTESGEVRLLGLPYIEGTVMLVSQWRRSHPREQDTPGQRIDAFTLDTIQRVQQVRKEVQEAFHEARQAW